MSRITYECKGDFKKTFGFLERCEELFGISALDKYGRKGVDALKRATPSDTGLAASSWYYEIEHNGPTTSLHFCNSDIEGGVNVAILLQYGHATKSGTFVEGIDYINPALEPIFNELCDEVMKGAL